MFSYFLIIFLTFLIIKLSHTVIKVEKVYLVYVSALAGGLLGQNCLFSLKTSSVFLDNAQPRIDLFFVPEET